MVTGGFKVWHIIFIMIAFAVTLTVVYCCFHRCRIPRTKQEIEADLMKSNLTNKFRDYLQDLPNEFTTFVEALKKVQELEEKLEKEDALFSRDAGARKRMGWLKLKGKEDKDKDIDKGKTELDEAEPVPVEVENPTHLATADSVQPVPKLEAKDSDVLQVDNVANENLKDNKEKLADDPDLKTSSRQPRRRRHKPNLSRTKRAREKSHSELEIEKTLEESKFESLANQDSKHNTHRVKTESKIESSIPREPKQHTHRVKTEPKIEAPSQQEPKQHTHHEETGPKVIPPKEARKYLFSNESLCLDLI